MLREPMCGALRKYEFFLINSRWKWSFGHHPFDSNRATDPLSKAEFSRWLMLAGKPYDNNLRRE
jgi:hypothetical protein